MSSSRFKKAKPGSDPALSEEEKMFGELMKEEQEKDVAKSTSTGKSKEAKSEDESIRVRFHQNFFAHRFFHAGQVARVKKSRVTDAKGNLLSFVEEVDASARSRQAHHDAATANPYGTSPYARSVKEAQKNIDKDA